MRYCPACQQRYGDDVELCPNDRIMTLVVSDALEGEFEGRVLDGRWSIEELLSEGGMGAVYRARQLSVDRAVAVKVIRQDAAVDAIMVSRFYRESKALSALQHPNIVTMFDFGQDDETGALFMVMELLKGRSLYEWQQARERFALRDVVQIGEQLFAALAEVHTSGVVHRDLKPENIYVERTANGRLHVKLLDFGIARLDQPELTRLTETGQLQGTPYYMAPEQIQGKAITERTDMYAAGAVLYELVAGVEPFQGDTLMAVLTQHLNDDPPSLTSNWALEGPVHPELIALIEALMVKAPEERPESSTWVWEQFRGLLDRMEEGGEGEPTSAAPEPDAPGAALAETALYETLSGGDAFSETVQVRMGGAEPRANLRQTSGRGRRAKVAVIDSRAELRAIREGARASQELDALSQTGPHQAPSRSAAEAERGDAAPESAARPEPVTTKTPAVAAARDADVGAAVAARGASAPARAEARPSAAPADALGQTFSEWSAVSAARDDDGGLDDDLDALVVAGRPAWVPAAALLGGVVLTLVVLWGAGVFDGEAPTPDTPAASETSGAATADVDAAGGAAPTAEAQDAGADVSAVAEADAADDAPAAAVVADRPPKRGGKAPRVGGASPGKGTKKKGPSADLDAILKGMRKP